jgi:hypothetical protein
MAAVPPLTPRVFLVRQNRTLFRFLTKNFKNNKNTPEALLTLLANHALVATELLYGSETSVGRDDQLSAMFGQMPGGAKLTAGNFTIGHTFTKKGKTYDDRVREIDPNNLAEKVRNAGVTAAAKLLEEKGKLLSVYYPDKDEKNTHKYHHIRYRLPTVEFFFEVPSSLFKKSQEKIWVKSSVYVDFYVYLGETGWVVSYSRKKPIIGADNQLVYRQDDVDSYCTKVGCTEATYQLNFS